jgi:hypothetical protein
MLLAALLLVLADGPLAAEDVGGRLGSAHVAGAYSVGRGDFLHQGADDVLATGMRVLKVYLLRPAVFYPHGGGWPDGFESPAAIARHPRYRSLFAKRFHTFVLTAYSTVGSDEHYFRGGVSDAQYAAEREQFRELAAYLLDAYRGTGKTFVLQNWEGDWAVRGTFCADPACAPTPLAVEGMVRWLAARQEGIDAARAGAVSDVRVLHACEANLAVAAMQGQVTVINDVFPRTRCDLYSYSAFDTIGAATVDPELGWSRALFRSTLDYIAAHAPDSAGFGNRNVMVGEFGWPEVLSADDPDASTEKSLRVLRLTVEEALEWGCPYILYWQVYDNEARRRPPTNADVRGFYLVRPDGTSSAARLYFARLLAAAAVARRPPP